MGTLEGAGGPQGLPGPPSTHGKAGGPRGPGVARLSWRSLCVRMVTLQCPRQVPTPVGHQCPPVPSPHSTHRLPFGSGEPRGATLALETLGGEKRGDAGGSPTAPPEAVPTWQQDLAQPVGSVGPAGTLPGLPPPLAQPQAPGAVPRCGGDAQTLVLSPWKAQPCVGCPGLAPALSSSLVPPVLPG